MEKTLFTQREKTDERSRLMTFIKLQTPSSENGGTAWMLVIKQMEKWG